MDKACKKLSAPGEINKLSGGVSPKKETDWKMWAKTE